MTNAISVKRTLEFNGYPYEKGLTGKDALRFKSDVEKHHGQIAGYHDFNGMTAPLVADGAVFNSPELLESFLKEFGKKYNWKMSSAIKAGIKDY